MLIFFFLSEMGPSPSVRVSSTHSNNYRICDIQKCWCCKFCSVYKPKRFWLLLKNFDDGEKKLFKLWFHSNWDNASWTWDFKLNDKWKNYRLVATWRSQFFNGWGSCLLCWWNICLFNFIYFFMHFHELYKFSNLVQF